MTIEINGIEDLPRAAKLFVGAIGERRVFAFYGKMGAGKTTFIKAVCEELGVRETVNSPTFAIVNEYLGGNGEPIYHFDFYRIKRIEEVQDIGYDEYVYSGCLCLMEWPELVEPLLPNDVVAVRIEEISDGVRRVTL
ncbi:MAG: tRNA (adenosine(37)-N6)-threonylcarbamoyltransferase complex ATPase subunit type 1 TsaE [Bacteroidaceae bacterium]|nr:tRNA (adenosine(37)-N6)-threonylcarbamoyltransferase complex ATPase subunit type 1 TsaE [Bacteroidaceae bacterium]